MSTPTFSYNFFILIHQSQTTFTMQTNMYNSKQVRMLPADAPKCECFLPTPFGKDKQKMLTTGSRTCCYKIYMLTFQAIGLLIFVPYNVKLP
jgi:hypothetical protein